MHSSPCEAAAKNEDRLQPKAFPHQDESQPVFHFFLETVSRFRVGSGVLADWLSLKAAICICHAVPENAENGGAEVSGEGDFDGWGGGDAGEVRQGVGRGCEYAVRIEGGYVSLVADAGHILREG